MIMCVYIGKVVKGVELEAEGAKYRAAMKI